MKVSSAVVHAALASVAASAAVELNKRVTPLDVKLEMVGNSEIKATVTNNGDKDLNLFIRNSFLDEAAIEKAEIYAPDSRVAFDGIRQRTNTKDLDNDSFTAIPAGEAIEATWDIAEMHDLSVGGDFDILTQGAIPYAENNSTKIVGAVPYLSNRLKANVAGAHAAKVRRSFLDKIAKIKRSTFTECSGEKQTSTTTAMENCQKLASAAADAATSDNGAFQEFFKNADASEVKKVLTAVAEECSSTTSGNAKYYCDEDSVPAEFAVGGCQSQVLAYTMPSQSLVVNCDLYYSALPALTDTCYDQDQATTTLHEFTHLSEIKGTDDLGYGYSAASQLSGSQALNNADSYALFANAVANNCVAGSGSSSGGSSSATPTGSTGSTPTGSTGTFPTEIPGIFPTETPSSGSGSGTGTGTGSGIGGIFTPGAGSGTGTGSGIGGIFTPIAEGPGSDTGSGIGGIFSGGDESGSETGTGIGAIFTPIAESGEGLGGLGGGAEDSSSEGESSSSSSSTSDWLSWLSGLFGSN